MQRGIIYKKSGSWLLQYRRDEIVDGQVVRKRVACKLAPVCDQYRSEASVKHLAQEILAPINARTARPESTQTVAGFIQDVYLPHCRETLRPSTARGYLDVFRLVAPHLGNLRLREVRTSDIDRLLRAVADSKARSHNALRNVKSFLSGAFRYAKRTDAISENPVRDSAIPRGKSKSDTPAYTLDEIQAMLAALKEPARTCVLVAALTGLRQSEIRGLRWDDFRGDELLVARSVWGSHVRETKTLSSHAAIPVLPILKRALDEHKARNCGDGFIFHGDTGKPLVLANLVRRDIRPALAKVGLEWKGWHGFRRGLGTALYTLGVPGKTVQALLRHAHLDTTMQFYVKPVQAESHKAMAKLEAAFTKSARRSRVA